MRKGSQAFTGFAPFAVFGIIGFACITGNGSGLLALVGLFFVLHFCNRLDSRSIRERSDR